MCEPTRDLTHDEHQVEQLVTEYRAGQVSRRDFMQRATVIMGGASMAGVLLMAADGAPIDAVARAAGQIDQAATPAATSTAMEIETSMVTFKTATDQAPGYLAKPKGEGPFKSVVVIQEWWGLDDHIKSIADRFAKMGYAALAPDLYRGEVAKEPSDAQRLIMKVTQPQALADIQGAVDYLIAQTYVKPAKAGVIGFCFGGRIALNMSYAGKNVGAVAVFYGGGINPTEEDFKNVSAPVIGFFGADDTGIPVDRVRGWEALLDKYNKPNEIYVYEGAPHSFFNDSRPSYRKEAAEDAWTKTLAWFDKYLVEGADMMATMSATSAATAAATPAATAAR
jgi:carboxymethylenebutenolidase